MTLSRKHKWIIKSFSTLKNLSSPNYTITYGPSAKLERKKEESRLILNVLIGGRPFGIEVKYALLCVDEDKREALLDEFQKKVQGFGLQFISRNIRVRKKNIFTQVLGFGKSSQTRDVHEIIAFVPPEKTDDIEFFGMLPAFGIRYYIPSDGGIEMGALDDILNEKLSENEIMNKFEFIVFDCVAMGRMGINSVHCSLEMLKNLLD
jgi:hypothetical protein